LQPLQSFDHITAIHITTTAAARRRPAPATVVVIGAVLGQLVPWR
jgi:hypothetical protein